MIFHCFSGLIFSGMVFFAHDQRVISQSSWIILWIYSSSLNSGTVSARASGRKMWAECTESVSSWRWELFAWKLSESVQRKFLSFSLRNRRATSLIETAKINALLLLLSELKSGQKWPELLQCNICHCIIVSWCPFRLARFGPTVGWWGTSYSNTLTHPIEPQSRPTLS